MDEVDEALSSDQLINVQVDYQSIRDVLSELTVQLDRAQHNIHDLQQHRELDALLSRLDKMEEHVQISSLKTLPINLSKYSVKSFSLAKSFP